MQPQYSGDETILKNWATTAVWMSKHQGQMAVKRSRNKFTTVSKISLILRNHTHSQRAQIASVVAISRKSNRA